MASKLPARSPAVCANRTTPASRLSGHGPAALPPSAKRAAFFHDLITGRAKGPTANTQRFVLSAFTAPYAVAIALRNFGYDRRWLRSEAVSVPVVSVGNLTMGGTGKTPCVEYIARYFRDRDVRTAILSRGYGSERSRNDEAMVLEENLPDVPHLQGADRVALAHAAIEELESELLILDDGFQHRRLRRSLDIVLIDASGGPEHGKLFPRGLLREPLTALKRADVILLTRCDQADANRLAALRDAVASAAPGKPVVESVHHPLGWQMHGDAEPQPLNCVDDHPVIAFCGIGHPVAFWRTLWHQSILPVSYYPAFPDHHNYTRDDVRELERWARAFPQDTVLATTQKDLVKLGVRELGGRPLMALRIGLELRAGAELLHKRLDGILSI